MDDGTAQSPLDGMPSLAGGRDDGSSGLAGPGSGSGSGLASSEGTLELALIDYVLVKRRKGTGGSKGGAGRP